MIASGQSEIGKWYDVLSIWRDWADHPRGQGIEGNHSFAEQTPEAAFEALYKFFTE